MRSFGCSHLALWPVRAIFLIVFLASSPVSAEEKSYWPYLEGMIDCTEMQYEGRDAALCAIHADGAFHWFIAYNDTWGGRKLVGDPVFAHALSQISLSPAQKYLAITAADEGHPQVALIDFDQWLRRGEVRHIWGAATYPGSIGIERWEGERLIVSSNHDLTDKDQLHLVDEPSDYHDYVVDPETGQVKRFVAKD